MKGGAKTAKKKTPAQPSANNIKKARAAFWNHFGKVGGRNWERMQEEAYEEQRKRKP
jgi:hypothetical protein